MNIVSGLFSVSIYSYLIFSFKNKQFYKLIGGIKGLDNYFKATLTDDKSITQFYATLAQVYEQEMEAPAYALPLGK